MFPQISILSGMYLVLQTLGLNTTWGGFRLIFSYLVFTLPFTIWILVGFVKKIPRDIEESALVDGATPFQAFFYVVAPLSTVDPKPPMSSRLSTMSTNGSASSTEITTDVACTPASTFPSVLTAAGDVKVRNCPAMDVGSVK